MKDFILKESSSGCNLSDIEGFVYGPFTSRFWMLRKQVLLADKKKMLNNPAFFAWDCITLQVKNKWDVCLIIRCEETMQKFLKLLIHHLETVDGTRGSAIELKNIILKKTMKKLNREGKSKVDDFKIEKVRKQINHDLMMKVYMKYNIMKVRQKISFSAFIKNFTLNELWMTQLANSF